MLIEKKEINIGKLVIVWDWFEACKWLNFFGGVFAFMGISFIFLVMKGFVKTNFFSIGIIVFSFMLFTIVSQMSNIISEDAFKK